MYSLVSFLVFIEYSPSVLVMIMIMTIIII